MKNSKADVLKNYGWFHNVFYNMKSTRAWDKKLFYAQILSIVPSIAGTYFGVLLPAEMVRGLENHWNIGPLLFYIFLLALGVGIAQILDETARGYIWGSGDKMPLYYEKLCYHKIMRLDYDRLEDRSAGS